VGAVRFIAGLGEYRNVVGNRGKCDATLLAVQDVSVAVAFRACAHAADIGAGLGLRDSNCREKASPGDFREETLALLLIAEMHQRNDHPDPVLTESATYSDTFASSSAARQTVVISAPGPSYFSGSLS